jgi:hypothetical protein
MPLQPLTFRDFAPDLDPITPGMCVDMAGFYPTDKGYRTLPADIRISNPLPSKAFGATSVLLLGTPLVAAATNNQLFVLSSIPMGAPYTPVPWIGQGLNLTNVSNRWRFAAYGQDLIAVDGVDAPQYYRLSNGAFMPLPGNPPVASLVATTDYAVILVPPNSQTLYSNLSDTGSWTPDVATEVYEYDLAQIAGNITGITRIRSLLAVYRQNAIQVATFVGGQIGWDFGQPGTITLNKGAVSQECVVSTGDVDYILGPDDFYSLDGYNFNRVPNHCKEWFFRDLDNRYIANVAGHWDPIRALVMWHYPSVNANPPGSLDSVIMLNVRTGFWGLDRETVDIPVIGGRGGIDIGFQPSHSVIKPDHTCTVDGQSLNVPVTSGVYITSNDFGDRHLMYQTRRVRPGFYTYPAPLGSAPPCRVTPLTQYVPGTTPVAQPTVAISDDGWANTVVTGRLTRFQVNVYGECELAQGDVDLSSAGGV